jgi:signal transduction histidine kinase
MLRRRLSTESRPPNRVRPLALYEIGIAFNSIRELDRLLDVLTRAVVDRLGAERASVALLDEHHRDLRLRVADRRARAAMRRTEITFSTELGITGWVVREGRPALVPDVTVDPRFDRDVDGPATVKTRSIICVPLRRGDRTLGAITAINKREGTFSRSDLRVLSTLARAAAVAIETAQLIAKLEAAQIALERRLVDRTAELRAADARLEEVSRHASRFLATMSHELRTPLYTILRFSELLQQPTSGLLAAQQARYVDRISSSAQHLLALMTDLLDLSTAETGRLALRFEPVSVRKSLEAAINDVRPLAEATGVTLAVDVETEADRVTADPVRFRQILYNLLANAVKFTPPDGRVTVTVTRGPDASGTDTPRSRRARCAHGTVKIAVADTGVGIRPDDLPRLFQPFAQLQPPLAGQHQGTGLGLALARQLVELHGGTISATSPGPSQGSTFTVILPVTPRTT